MWPSLYLLLGLAHADVPPVEMFVTDEGGRVVISVRATTRSVFIPSCRALSWERFDEATQTYSALPGAPCGPMAAAIPLDEKGMTLEEAPLTAGFQVVRPVLVYGMGCRPGLPLPIAECDRIDALIGPYTPVRGAAPAEP